MAAVSNYSQHPCGPQWLIYSGALGGAVRERTPSTQLCSLTMLNALRFKTLNARPQVTLRGYVIVYFTPPHTHSASFFLSFYLCASVSAVRCRF